MAAWISARLSPPAPGGRIHSAAEAAGAFLASAVFFLAAGAVSPAIQDHLALTLALGGGYLCVVLWGAKRLGPTYGVPLAISGGVAFDSFYIPPLREFGSDNWQNWLVVVIYIGLGVLVGMLAARFRQRAELSEQGRGALVNEQAALRRVATLVAREVPSAEVLHAVAAEVAGLLGADNTMMLRYESDDTATDVGGAGKGHSDVFGGNKRLALDGESVTAIVRRTGAPARIDDYSGATGMIGTAVRAAGMQSVVGCPIIVGGRLWGCLVAATRRAESMPPNAEDRIAQFTELVGTSISNVQAREELAASRARIVAATDEERRRVVRDLHDGAQQRLVHTVVTLKLALRALGGKDDTGRELVSEALGHAETAMVELRELAHGILPSVLNRGGLRAGVEALASRMPVPVEIGVGPDRFPTAVEATAYFVVAEALTNVAKHAHAGRATVTTDVDDGSLRIEIADDGTGTADPGGHGLLGLADRLASREGALQVVSAPGDGTRVIATVPLKP